MRFEDILTHLSELSVATFSTQINKSASLRCNPIGLFQAAKPSSKIMDAETSLFLQIPFRRFSPEYVLAEDGG
jgi:hypothetical protein